MLRLAADENLNNHIVRGLLRRRKDLDIVRIQDAGLSGAPDPVVPERAAREKRVFLTHDVSTITRYAIDRIETGQSMPGVFEIDGAARVGHVIEDILLLAELSIEDEWEGQIGYVPLK